MFKKIIAVAAASVLFSSVANASIYQYDRNYPAGSSGAGDLESITLNYDDQDDRLYGSFNLVEKNNKLANTGWLVLSPGKNPKGSEGDHGILYMDFLSGDSWLYQYNGQNNPTSYKNSDLLAFYDNSLMVDENGSSRNVTFNYDFSGVTAPTPGWTGASFGEKVGVWFHGLVGKFSADETGVKDYQATQNGQFWHDTSYKTTTSVPEIDGAGLPLAAFLMLAVVAIFREKKAK